MRDASKTGSPASSSAVDAIHAPVRLPDDVDAGHFFEQIREIGAIKSIIDWEGVVDRDVTER